MRLTKGTVEITRTCLSTSLPSLPWNRNQHVQLRRFDLASIANISLCLSPWNKRRWWPARSSLRRTSSRFPRYNIVHANSEPVVQQARFRYPVDVLCYRSQCYPDHHSPVSVHLFYSSRSPTSSWVRSAHNFQKLLATVWSFAWLLSVSGLPYGSVKYLPFIVVSIVYSPMRRSPTHLVFPPVSLVDVRARRSPQTGLSSFFRTLSS